MLTLTMLVITSPTQAVKNVTFEKGETKTTSEKKRC